MISRNYNLIKGDWKIIGRDPMLILCLIAPILLILVATMVFPLASDLSIKFINFSLEPYFPVGSLFLFPLTAMLLGMVYGFILLDERDGGLISYLAITPMGKSGYLQIRMLMPVMISFLMNIVFLVCTGFLQFLKPVEIIVISFITSFEAPMILLFLAAFADNKVEGMAISKGFGIIMLPMLIDYFFTGSWRWIMALSPAWWIERAIFNEQPVRWFYMAGAALVHFIIIALLYRKFEKRVG
jgi:fluoroquinolone transport system permease protein